MPLRVARQDRRWKGSCGRNLVPGSVWCKEGQHPVGRCAWGVRSAADPRPGVAVTGSLVCTQPRLLDTVAVRTSLSIDSSPGSWPLAWEKSLDFHLLHVLCSVHLRLEHEEQDISPRYPTCSHHTTVQEDRARLANVSAQGPREHALFSSLTHIPVLGCSWLCLVITLHK